MKRIYEKDEVAACIAKSKYHDVLESLDIDRSEERRVGKECT